MSQAAEVRMPPIGADVHLAAYCNGCGRTLGRWNFVWDGEPRKFSSHICSGQPQNVVYQMQWLEVGDGGSVSGSG